MTQKVKYISTFKEDDVRLTPEEQHFGFPCFLASRTTDQSVHIQFSTKLMTPTGESISQSSEVCLLGGEKQKYGFGFCFPWEKVVKKLVVDDCLVVEVCAHILDISGFEKTEKFRNFDESMKEFSDVVLVVKDAKFYVLKTYLAAQSNYFKVLLLGDFEEGKSLEVTLNSIDPNDSQNFLEVLYGHHQAITDE